MRNFKKSHIIIIIISTVSVRKPFLLCLALKEFFVLIVIIIYIANLKMIPIV